MIVEFTQNRVKINTKIANLKRYSRIKKYNGEYGSNPQRNKQILRYLMKLDQIV